MSNYNALNSIKGSKTMSPDEIRNMTNKEIQNAWIIINNSWDYPEDCEDETTMQRRDREWFQDAIYSEYYKRFK